MVGFVEATIIFPIRFHRVARLTIIKICRTSARLPRSEATPEGTPQMLGQELDSLANKQEKKITFLLFDKKDETCYLYNILENFLTATS